MKSIITAKKLAKKIAKEKDLKLKEALDLIAKENGFPAWKEYRNSLDTFWYDKATPFLTQWFTKHQEAKFFIDLNGGYLLTFKGQYFVVDADYIEYIGIDPKAEIWSKISYDISGSQAFDKMYEYLKSCHYKGL